MLNFKSCLDPHSCFSSLYPAQKSVFLHLKFCFPPCVLFSVFFSSLSSLSSSLLSFSFMKMHLLCFLFSVSFFPYLLSFFLLLLNREWEGRMMLQTKFQRMTRCFSFHSLLLFPWFPFFKTNFRFHSSIHWEGNLCIVCLFLWTTRHSGEEQPFFWVISDADVDTSTLHTFWVIQDLRF